MTCNRFDKAAATWDDNPNRMAVTRAIAEAIVNVAPLSPSMSLLDFGCGTGALSVLLAEKVGRIDAVDASAGMIEKLREKLAAAPALAAKITPAVAAGRIERIAGGPWDVVCTSMVLHHIEDADAAVGGLAGRVASGGRLILVDLFPENGSFHRDDSARHNGFDPARLAEIVEQAGLRDVSVVTATTVVKPGADGVVREYAVFCLTAVAP